ncbi:MAG: preprotein translocase subunit SecG [Gammaproteobacteria bacterium]|nr:preprotein translocase subunit SecG [Gammaproteobacteria bacterium]
MQTILLTFHVLVAIALIALILLQQGKGADAGAAFGSGASGSVFGAKGSSSFLSRTTAILATLFFVLSLAMAILSSEQTEQQSLTQQFEESQVVTPAVESTDIPASGDVPAVPMPEAP